MKKANFFEIQFEDLRRKVDPKYIAFVEKLEDCYYNHWKKGLPSSFEMAGVTYNVRPTVEQSKEQFDLLHGAIWKQYDIEFEEENLKLPEAPQSIRGKDRQLAEKRGFYMDNGIRKQVRIAKEAYNNTNEAGVVVKTKKEEALDWLQENNVNVTIPEISDKEAQTRREG